MSDTEVYYTNLEKLKTIRVKNLKNPKEVKDNETSNFSEINSPFHSLDESLKNNKKIINIVFSTILITLFGIFIVLVINNPRNAWELINMILTMGLMILVLTSGKYSVNKSLTLMVFMLNLVYFIVYFFVTNFQFISFESWNNLYPHIDQIAHFNMGWMLYHAFRSLFDKTPMAYSILFGILFELGYELLEVTYWQGFGLWTLYSPDGYLNLIQDIIANSLGSSFGFLIEYLFFKHRQN